MLFMYPFCKWLSGHSKCDALNRFLRACPEYHSGRLALFLNNPKQSNILYQQFLLTVLSVHSFKPLSSNELVWTQPLQSSEDVPFGGIWSVLFRRFTPFFMIHSLSTDWFQKEHSGKSTAKLAPPAVSLAWMFFSFWLREPDLNWRPSGYEPDELPSCSIPRYTFVCTSRTDLISIPHFTSHVNHFSNFKK